MKNLLSNQSHNLIGHDGKAPGHYLFIRRSVNLTIGLDMQIELNEDIIKTGTKRATRYLSEAGTAVPTGNFYEALARFHNYESWNVMVAAMKKGSVKTPPTLTTSTSKKVNLGQLRKRADKALAEFDFAELYDGAIVVTANGWEWVGMESCSCAVFLELDDEEPDVDSTKVTFTVSFDKNGRIDEVNAS